MDAEDRELLVRIDMNVRALLETKADHETRLRAGERERWIARVGLIGLVAYVCGKLGLPLPAIFS